MTRNLSKRIGIGLGITFALTLGCIIKPIDEPYSSELMNQAVAVSIADDFVSTEDGVKKFAFTIFPVIPYIREKFKRQKSGQDHIIRLAADKQYSYEYRTFIIDLATRDPEHHALDSKYGQLVFHHIITDKQEHEKLREYALLKIREHHHVHIPFERIIKDHSEPIRVRCAALTALGRTDAEGFSRLFFKMLKSHTRYNSDMIQHAFLCADKTRGLMHYLDGLKAVIKEAGDQEMFNKILQALGRIGGQSNVRIVIELYDLVVSEAHKIKAPAALMRTVLMNHEADIISLLQSTSDYDRELGARAAKLGNIRTALSIISDSQSQAAD